MRNRNVIILTALVVCCALVVMAKDFWEQPFTKWKPEDVVKIATNSPWAQVQTFASLMRGKNEDRRDEGSAGEHEFWYKYTAQFFSSLPVREAFVRGFQIKNGYDDMKDAQKAEFDGKFKRLLSGSFGNADVKDSAIVAVKFETNDPNGMRDIKQWFDQATADTLKQNAFLISDRLGQVEIKGYFPPAPDGTGAKFIFPKMVKDQPVAIPQDKELKFVMYWVPGANDKLFLTFKPSKMVYKGDLSY